MSVLGLVQAPTQQAEAPEIDIEHGDCYKSAV
jgi:hypothetical protein